MIPQKRSDLPFKCSDSFDLWCYPLDSLPVETSPFDEILALWRERRSGALVPPRSAFKFSDFLGWHPKLGLSKPDHDGVLRFGFVGEEFKLCFGYRMSSGAEVFDIAEEIPSSEFKNYFSLISDQVESSLLTHFVTPGLDPGVQKPEDFQRKDGLPDQVRQ